MKIATGSPTCGLPVVKVGTYYTHPLNHWNIRYPQMNLLVLKFEFSCCDFTKWFMPLWWPQSSYLVEKPCHDVINFTLAVWKVYPIWWSCDRILYADDAEFTINQRYVLITSAIYHTGNVIFKVHKVYFPYIPKLNSSCGKVFYAWSNKLFQSCSKTYQAKGYSFY